MRLYSKGVFVPLHIWESDELSTLEKYVLSDIWNRSNPECCDDNKTIASRCQASTDVVARCLEKLVHQGYLDIALDGKKNRYIVVTKKYFLEDKEVAA
jgi:predicted transcriptional regulator